MLEGIYEKEEDRKQNLYISLQVTANPSTVQV